VQVAAWERGGAASAGLVPAPALALWRLAAGDVLSAVRALGPFLPWPRLLALHLWFAVDAASPLAAAVEALEATLRDLGIDRHPHPWYAHAQAHGEALPPAAAAMASVAPRRRIYDTAFELLRAATGQLPAPAGRRGACAPLARVLRPPGATPDRLDYAQAWCLMGLARAGGCLPEILGGGAGAWEAARVCLGLVGQLEACGGDLAPWAAWVAACIPDDAATPEQRAALVESVLCRTAPAWPGDPASEAFLREVLGPDLGRLVDVARALCLAAEGDAEQEMLVWMDAGEAALARPLLARSVGPRLALAGGLRAMALLRRGCEAVRGARPASPAEDALVEALAAFADVAGRGGAGAGAGALSSQGPALHAAMQALLRAEGGAASLLQKAALEHMAALVRGRMAHALSGEGEAELGAAGQRHVELGMLRDASAADGLLARGALDAARQAAALAAQALGQAGAWSAAAVAAR